MEQAASFLDQFGTLLLLGYFALYFGVNAALCYTLQALSDKTEAAPSWVAWVPIVQTHAFVRASGTSYKALLGWIGAGIALAILGARASGGGPTPAPFAFAVVVYGVAALVWFAGTLWRLAERRGLSGWVGLACLIPLLGLLFYLYIALHDGLVRPSGVGLAIGALLALVAVAGARQQLQEARALFEGEMRITATEPGDASGTPGESLLGQLLSWKGDADPVRPPEKVEIPDAVVCEPGTRIAGARPPLGKAMWCERVSDGRRHGWYLSWYPDGSMREAGRYADGLRQGVWTRFWDSGGRHTQVNFERGREHGILLTWDELGRVQREIRYEMGEPAPLHAAR